MTSFLTAQSDLVNKNGKSWVLVGSPKDGQKPSGSLSSCQVDFAKPRDISCQVRPPNLNGASKDDNFDDQLLGVSVLAVSPSGGNTEVIRTVNEFNLFLPDSHYPRSLLGHPYIDFKIEKNIIIINT